MGVAAALTGLGLYALWRSGRMARVLSALDDTASQLRVRGAFVILLIFAASWMDSGSTDCSGRSLPSGAARGRPRRSSQHRDLPGQARCDWIRISHTGVLRRHRSPVQRRCALLADLGARTARSSSFRSHRPRRTGPALPRTPRDEAGHRRGVPPGNNTTFPVVVAEIGLSLGLLSQATAAALIGAGAALGPHLSGGRVGVASVDRGCRQKHRRSSLGLRQSIDQRPDRCVTP